MRKTTKLERQSRIYEYIKAHIFDKGYPPAIRDICRDLDIKSTSTAFSDVRELAEKGLIKLDGKTSRGISLIEAPGDFSAARSAAEKLAAFCNAQESCNACEAYGEAGACILKARAFSGRA